MLRFLKLRKKRAPSVRPPSANTAVKPTLLQGTNNMRGKQHPHTLTDQSSWFYGDITHPELEVLFTEVLGNDLVGTRLLIRESKLIRSDLRQGADAVLSPQRCITTKQTESRTTRE